MLLTSLTQEATYWQKLDDYSNSNNLAASLHLLKQLHLLPVEWRIKFKITTLTSKALETGLPPYSVHQLCPSASNRASRSSTSKLLQVPCTNLRFGSHSFRVSSPTLWNSLSHGVHFSKSLTTFWKQLKTFYFPAAFSVGPLTTDYPNASDSVLDFGHFINSFTYLPYLLITVLHQ